MKKPLGEIVDAFTKKYGKSKIEDDEELSYIQQDLQFKLQRYTRDWGYTIHPNDIANYQRILPELFPAG